MKNLILIIALIFSINIVAQKELIDTFEITKQYHFHASEKYSNCTGNPECVKQQIKEMKECYWEPQIGINIKESSVSRIIVIQNDDVTVKLYNGLKKMIMIYTFPNSFIRDKNNGMRLNNPKQSLTFYSNAIVLTDKYGFVEFNFDGHKEESKDK